jgi:UDP:flavonoid glycosyltransferase YjiC (YdhE family)
MQRIRNSAINQFMQGNVFASLQNYIDGVLAACGVARLPSFLTDAVVQLPDAYLQIGVPALEYPRSNVPAHLKFIGVPRGMAAAGAPPDWWPEVAEARAAGRKVCLVTQGTVASADLDQLLRPAFEALASTDILVIATTSGADLGRYAANAPRNVRLARFIPYALALAHADLLITNGGFGGVLLALTHGVPLIVAGDSEEKPEIAARVAHAGVGIDLKTGRPAPALIAAAAADIFGNGSYAQRAREMAALIASIDSIALIESTLETIGRAAAA